MNLSLLLGVSSGQPFGADGSATAPADPSIADGSALAAAFGSLVDQLMGDRADDAPLEDVPARGEAEDLEAEIEAQAENDATNPEWNDSRPQTRTEVWLVELEIVNRTPAGPAGPAEHALSSHPNRAAVDDREVPHDAAAAADDTLAALVAMPSPAVITAGSPTPQAVSTGVANQSDTPAATTTGGMTTDTPAWSAHTGVPTGSTSSSQPAAEPTRESVAPPPDARTTAPARAEKPRAAETITAQAESRPSLAGAGPSDAPTPSNDTVSGTTAAPPAPSGTARATRPGAASPAPPSTAGRAETNAAAQSTDRLQSFMTRETALTVTPIETAVTEAAVTETSSTRPSNTTRAASESRANVSSPEARVDAVSRVVEAKPSTAAPDRSRVAETPLPLVRPLAADIQALGTATVAYGHDVLGGRVTAGASPTVSVAPPAPTTAALPDDTARQIAQSIRLQVSRGGGEATIQLDPRHFGEMSITIRIEHGQVNARVQADSPVVREYLQSHHHVLRDSLAEQQLTLSKFEVAEPPAEPRQGDRRPADERAFQGERQPPRRRQPGTAASSFEPFEVIA